MKYKIIQEYERFYVCEYEVNHQKIRECFMKDKNLIIENGYVIVKENKNEEVKWL